MLSSRARRQAETRTLLLDAAEQLFCRDGYAATTLARVASTAGFTTGAVYANFAGKEQLFLELHERRLASLIDELHIDVRDAGAAGSVPALGLALAQVAERQRLWALAAAEFWARAARQPPIAATLRPVHRRVADRLRELIRSALPNSRSGGEGTGDDEEAVDDLVRLVMALVDGLSLQAYVTDFGDFVGVFSRAFVKLAAPSSHPDAIREVAR